MDTRIGPRSYKDVVTQPVYAWQIKQQGAPRVHTQLESKSQLIHRRFTELLQRSTYSHPICLKCGSPGHFAKGCRNALLCFICNKLRHKARECTATSLAFPPTPPLKLRNPRILAERRAAFQAAKIRTPAMVPPLRTPIVTLTPSTEAELMEKQFRLSFILDDIAGWGPDKVEKILRQKFKRADHLWIATVYEEFQYLIQALTKAWLDSVAARGILVLEGVEFPILAWEPEFDEGLYLTPIWVRIKGFPKFQWSWIEVEKVFYPLGAHLLELDPKMGGRYDWRFLRAKLGVCDVKLIPPVHYVKRLTPSGKIKVFDITIDIENEQTESVHAWRARLNGQPYPNRTEFGMQQIWDEAALATLNGDEDPQDDLEFGSYIQAAEVTHDTRMEEKDAVSRVATMTSGCRPGAGMVRKRDEDDGAAPGSDKKGTMGNGTSKSGTGKLASSTKASGKSGGSGNGTRTTRHSLPPTPGESVIPLSPNSFHPLTDLQPELCLTLNTPLAANEGLPHHKTPTGTDKRATKPKSTWGSKKKQHPMTIKKSLTMGRNIRSGMAARLRSAKKKVDAEVMHISDSTEQSLNNLSTLEVVDTATTGEKQIVPHKSLRVQAQADPSSTMTEAKKRIKKQRDRLLH